MNRIDVQAPPVPTEHVRRELLRSIELFEGLSDDDLDALGAEMLEHRFAAGEAIFSAGEAGTTMYVVVSGDVNIHLPGDDSRRISLKDVARGEYFGELALFDEKPRSASAVATTPTLLLELTRAMLTRYLSGRPHATLAILRVMSERLRETNALLSARATKNVVEEIEKNLTWADRLADRVAELNGSWSFILMLLGLSVGWFFVNSHGVASHPFDEYPYTFFNLLLAILVALQGPLIVMSQNRQTLKDRAQAETDFHVNLKNEVNIETILRELGEFRRETDERLRTLEGRSF